MVVFVLVGVFVSVDDRVVVIELVIDVVGVVVDVDVAEVVRVDVELVVSEVVGVLSEHPTNVPSKYESSAEFNKLRAPGQSSGMEKRPANPASMLATAVPLEYSRIIVFKTVAAVEGFNDEDSHLPLLSISAHTNCPDPLWQASASRLSTSI